MSKEPGTSFKIPASSVTDGLFVKVSRAAGEGIMRFTVPTLEEASRVCLEFIQDDALGSSEWCGGEVVSETTDLCVAVVSYNGRVWFPGGRNPEGSALADPRFEYDLSL